MRTIAIEEHFITPMYREKVSANEFRNFYLNSRSEQIGHNIFEQNMDLGEQRLAFMDAAGVDVQVLSFGSPGPQGFDTATAIPMARDANDRLYEAMQAHPDRFAGFAALATAAPEAAADELERCVTKLGFKGVMVNGYTQVDSPDNLIYLDDPRMTVFWEALTALDTRFICTRARRATTSSTTGIRNLPALPGASPRKRRPTRCGSSTAASSIAFRPRSWCWDTSASRFRFKLGASSTASTSARMVAARRSA
jgi:predicted TIM-barrel fold metal-dependent hydrolase